MATRESHAFWTFKVAGDLDVDPRPTVVTATSRHFTSTRLELTESGRVRLRERIQIGSGSVADDALATPMRASANSTTRQ